MEDGKEQFDFDQIEEQFDFDQIENLEQNAVEGETQIATPAPHDNLEDAPKRIEKEFKKEKE